MSSVKGISDDLLWVQGELRAARHALEDAQKKLELMKKEMALNDD